MAGYSDLPYRLIAREMGSAVSFTEFSPAVTVTHKPVQEQKRIVFHESERPVIVQLFGNEPAQFVRAALYLAETDFRPEGIDINMGCSVQRVSSRGSGAGLLKNIPLAARIASELVKLNLFAISAKIRLGWDDASKNYLEVATALESEGVRTVSVHARTKSQGYKGSADWDAIGEVAQKVKIPVFGNGDLQSHEDAQTRIRQHRLRGALIGRAAMGNPWIFLGKNKSDMALSERLPTIRRHLSLMADFYGSAMAARLFRKHLTAYLSDLDISPQLRSKLFSAVTAEGLRSCLAEDCFSDYE